MEWAGAGTTEEPASGAETQRVVLRGMGWRVVAHFLRQMGAELVIAERPSERRGALAELNGNGWRASVHENVEFVGALRTNRVEVRVAGEPAAVEDVIDGLRRMAVLKGALPGQPPHL